MEIWRDYFLSLYFCFHAYVFRAYSIVTEQAQCASTSFSPVITSQYYIMLEICKCGCAMLSCSVCIQLFATPWTVAHQAPLSMGFSWQEYWSGLPCPPPGDLPNPGIKPKSPTLQADSLPPEPPGKQLKVCHDLNVKLQDL